MSAIDQQSIELTPAPEPPTSRARWLRIARWLAIACWAAVIIYRTATDGFAFNRELVLVYVCTGLAAASIGQGRRMLYIIRDWLPFALVLIAYDLSRGAADMVGRPTLWEWPVDVDRWLFFGTVPTVWLQEQLKLPEPPWWEVVISSVYMSFFILPYAVAGALWLRNREEWKAFVQLFVGLSLAGLAIYALVPAAPPWAAARCSPADVVGGPANPRCMFRRGSGEPDGGLLGAMQTTQDGANDWVERIVGRGWGKLNLHSATALLDQGQASVNLVAAIPSLHAAMTAAVAMYLWNRVHRAWRPLLVLYPLVMAFTLIYTAEHYVIDILLGWALAALMIVGLARWHSWRTARRARANAAAVRPPDGAPLSSLGQRPSDLRPDAEDMSGHVPRRSAVVDQLDVR